MKEKLRLDIRKTAACVFVLFLFCLLTFGAGTGIRGVKKGLSICAGQIIPSLFPFCVACTFLVKSDIINVFAKVSAPLMKLFNLSGTCAGAVILSFTGGYPVGAITANSLYEKGDITKDEYKRMMLFCVNAGPAFVIGTVGNSILKSFKTGIILFLSLTLSGIILGILSGFTAQDEKREEKAEQNKISTLSEAFVKSVSESTFTMLNICAWIVLFSCALEFTESLKISRFFKDFIICAGEVTKGCSISLKYKNIPLTAFVLGFAGLSVHLQVFKFIKTSGIKYMHFLCSRIVNAGLASLISFLLLKAVPCTQDVFGSITNPAPQAFSVSLVSAVSMLVMGISFVLELDRSLRKC